MELIGVHRSEQFEWTASKTGPAAEGPVAIPSDTEAQMRMY